LGGTVAMTLGSLSRWCQYQDRQALGTSITRPAG
jgi:hypothetical protein